jgi:hypothetical protein
MGSCNFGLELRIFLNNFSGDLALSWTYITTGNLFAQKLRVQLYSIGDVYCHHYCITAAA